MRVRLGAAGWLGLIKNPGAYDAAGIYVGRSTKWGKVVVAGQGVVATDNCRVHWAVDAGSDVTGRPGDDKVGWWTKLRGRAFRRGRLRVVSEGLVREALRCPGREDGDLGLGLVRVPNDQDGLTTLQARYLKDALRGLDPTRLRYASWDGRAPVRLSDGERWAWIMPVVSTVEPDAPVLLTTDPRWFG